MAVRQVCLLALIADGVLVLVSDLGPRPGRILTEPSAARIRTACRSTDLGPSHRADTQVTASLQQSRRPEALFGQATDNGLAVRWQPGQYWPSSTGRS